MSGFKLLHTRQLSCGSVFLNLYGKVSIMISANIWWLQCISFSDVLIGFSEDVYTGDEGEPGDVSRPNTPCTVTVEIIERTLEIPLQIKLTPREQSATSKN